MSFGVPTTRPRLIQTPPPMDKTVPHALGQLYLSSIRLFIDWAVWVRDEPGHRYMLRFVTRREVAWQETSFSALASLLNEVVRVERT
jgi:hypothetical protein